VVCWLFLGWRGPPTATGADVFVNEMLDDKQRCRPVIELLAPVGADVHADLATVRTDALGLGQFVMPGLAGQILRQATTTVRAAPPLRLARRWRFGGRLLCRVLARGHLHKQQQLVGIEAFATRSIQAPQQQIDAVPEPLDVAITLVQRSQQFQDHALERGYIIGQVLGVGWWQSSSSGVRKIHAY
jgi:hypothetical protein